MPAKKNAIRSIPMHHAVVENLQPRVDGGKYPVKAVTGETIEVTADIYRDGHEKCEADLLYRRRGVEKWRRTPMRFVDNDQWAGEFMVDKLGFWEFTIDVHEKPYLYPDFGIIRADPALCEFSAWYEMFARSQGTVPGKSATFADMERRLAEIKELGFDLIYLPPIHPIGLTNRKGKNNAIKAEPGEPGSPYAIGSCDGSALSLSKGGHKAVHPGLGTLKDCRRFFQRCREMGFAVALDYALNCSPDHPYVKSHPDWFYREKDGAIKCAENPPKRYEDIYPLNFFCEDRENLWLELKSIVDFWIKMGVTVFRVDNPHTKPFAFWEWLIAEVKSRRPEVVFLAEAFTRPKIMKRLAKIGFDMSYTYFTWRETARELREYLEELTREEPRLYMKPIFFPTTPDILPKHLQNAPREMFMIRFALSCTLAGAYGMYNGYELCENIPYPGREELLDSEKYEYKVRDWNLPGNIKDFIRTLNRIRDDHPALHRLKNLRFHGCDNPVILAYSKAEAGDILLFVVNLDPLRTQSGFVTLDLASLQVAGENIFGVHDLLTGESYAWSGERNYVELNPFRQVLHVFKVEKF
jgi:starch synthase (maltosyl-transferring)